MHDITNAQADQIAGAQLAVYSQIKQSQITDSIIHLQADPDRSHLIKYQGRLLPRFRTFEFGPT
jgi:hypothetical protein